MGNSFLSVQTQEIKMKNGDPFQIITKQLQGKKNFPKTPSKDEIDKQFNDWLKQTLLEQREKDQIQQLDLKYKFRICQLYSKYIQDKLAEKEKEKKIKIEITKQFVQKLLSEQSDINLNQLLNNFREPQYILEKIQILKQYSIVPKLLIKLQKLEEQSRIQKKYREQITILEFFELLLQSKAGRDILQVDGFFQILFSNFHPIETKITGITLKILSGSRGLSWEQGCVQLILDAMLNFQKNYKLLNRFDILVRTIYVSKNLIMVYLIIKFLFKFLYSLDNQEVDYVVKEFFDSRVNDKKVDEIFRQIKQRIQKKLYKKEDCTFEAVKKQLQQFEHPLASENQEQPLTSRFRTVDLQPTQIVNDEQSLQLEKPEIFNQDFKNDSYYYFETGQDQIFIGIQQSVLEWINAIQSISQLLDENQESFIRAASQLHVVDFYYDENSTICSDPYIEIEQNERNSNTEQQSPDKSDQERKNKSSDQQSDNSIQELQEQIKELNRRYRIELEKQELLYLQLKEKSQLELDNKTLIEKVKLLEKNIQNSKQTISSLLSQVSILEKKVKQNSQLLKNEENLISIQITNETQTDQSKLSSNSAQQIIKIQLRPSVINNETKKPQNQNIPNSQSIQQANENNSKLLPPPPPPPSSFSQTSQKTSAIPPPPPPPPIMGANSLKGIPPPPPPPPNLKSGGPPTPPPPPPPNLKSGGPPPPPPPPPPPNSKFGGPPPPPPRMGIEQKVVKIETPFLPKQTPKIQMKNLNWNQINQQAFKGSIFEQIQNQSASDQIEINFELLEKSFSKQQPKDIISRPSCVIQTKITLLSGERSKNIELVLGKLKLPCQILAKALMNLDDKILSPSMIDSLDAICPTDEEIKLLSEFNGDKDQLGNPEQFVDAIRQVKGFQFRLKAMKFKQNFQDSREDFNKKISHLMQLFTLVRSMPEIQVLFRTLIEVGNFLNINTNKGGAFGFKLDAVEKCSDMKTSDNQENLLYFIIDLTEKQLKKELISDSLIQNFELMERLSVSQLNSDVLEFKKGLNHVSKALESQTNEESDKVTQVLQPFFNDLAQQIKMFEEQIIFLDENYRQSAQYFCENPKESSEKFGEKILKLFKCLLKNKKEKIQKEERKKKQEELQQKQLQRLSKTNSQNKTQDNQNYQQIEKEQQSKSNEKTPEITVFKENEEDSPKKDNQSAVMKEIQELRLLRQIKITSSMSKSQLEL